MSYRTKRPPTRKLLVFGVGVTLAISQLGAGCVPASRPGDRCGPDATIDDAGNCSTPAAAADDASTQGDAKK